MKVTNIVKRTVAGISALCVVSGTFTAFESGSQTWKFTARAADDALVYGDFNCDGAVDLKDVQDISKFVKDSKSVDVSSQALDNGDVYGRSSSRTVNSDDAKLIIEFLAGKNAMPANSFASEPQAVVYGDADCDGDVDFDDVSAIENYVADKEKNPLTPEGINNADIFGRSSARIVNSDDAKLLIEYLAGTNTVTANSFASEPQTVVYGDADCDGDVDFDDVTAIENYVSDSKNNPLTPEGINNADIFGRSSARIVNSDDAKLLIEYLAGTNTVTTNTFATAPQAVVYGDADCDGDVDFDDVDAIEKYAADKEKNPLTPEGINNADVCSRNSSRIVNTDDAKIVIEYLAGKNTITANSFVSEPQAVVYGDADCNGYVDYNDVIAVLKYQEDHGENALTPEGMNNADVYSRNSSRIVNTDDAHLILEYILGENNLPVNTFVTSSDNITYELKESTVYGDFNLDGVTDSADIDEINVFLSEPKKYKLSLQAAINADVCNPGYGINQDDIGAIEKYISDKSPLPVYSEDYRPVLYGDFNCDNVVNVTDATMLEKYLYKISDYKPSEQGLKNANAYKKDTTELDKDDLKAITECVAGTYALPTEELAAREPKLLYGDFNCDNAVNVTDATMLEKYLYKISDYKPSEQGLKNANVYKKDTTELDKDDLKAITECVAGTYSLPTEELVSREPKLLYGDFNCDNVVNVTDATMLEKYLLGISEYKPSEQGLKNANVYKKDSTELDKDDLKAITECVAKLYDLPTEELAAREPKLLYGDFNCDNVVNIADATMLEKYLLGISQYKPSAQGLENANVYKKDSTELDMDDVQAITEAVALKYPLPAEELAPTPYYSVHGDFNCDNVFDIRDAVMFYSYIENISSYVPSEQGKKNANISGSDKDLNYDDLLIMINKLNPVPEEEIDLSKLNGDVNEDGKVNAEDLVYVRNVLLGSEKYKATCDVSADGSFSTRDFVILKNLILQPKEK